MNNIEVVYTMWANLKKTGGMDVGQVGFHKQRDVGFTTKINNIIVFIFKKPLGEAWAIMRPIVFHVYFLKGQASESGKAHQWNNKSTE